MRTGPPQKIAAGPAGPATPPLKVHEQCWVCIECNLRYKILLLLDMADMDCLLCGRLCMERAMLSAVFF